MKQLLLFSFSVLLLFACKKDKNPANDLTSDHYIRYKANGQLIKHEGVYSEQLLSGVRATERIAGHRMLVIDGSSSSGGGFSFMLNTDSIRSGQTYLINDNANNDGAGMTIGDKHY